MGYYSEAFVTSLFHCILLQHLPHFHLLKHPMLIAHSSYFLLMPLAHPPLPPSCSCLAQFIVSGQELPRFLVQPSALSINVISPGFDHRTLVSTGFT